MSEMDVNDLRRAYLQRDDVRFEELLQRNKASDFYRRMRFSAKLFPLESGNEQAKKTWGDIFDAFTRVMKARTN